MKPVAAKGFFRGAAALGSAAIHGDMAARRDGLGGRLSIGSAIRGCSQACGGAAARENPYRAAKSADKKAGRSPETGKFCGGQPRK